MNTANVIPPNAAQAGGYATRAQSISLTPVRVRFEAFELDEPNALLLRDGKAVALTPKAFALLCALARRPGTLLTKSTLLDDVWGHQFVSDSVLKTAISDLRAALKDDPRQPRFIETVSRRGYRFIALTAAISVAGAVAVSDVAAPSREIGCAVAQPAFATLEDLRYAHELRLRLRAVFLRHSPTWSVPGLSAPMSMAA